MWLGGRKADFRATRSGILGSKQPSPGQPHHAILSSHPLVKRVKIPDHESNQQHPWRQPGSQYQHLPTTSQPQFTSYFWAVRVTVITVLFLFSLVLLLFISCVKDTTLFINLPFFCPFLLKFLKSSAVMTSANPQTEAEIHNSAASRVIPLSISPQSQDPSLSQLARIVLWKHKEITVTIGFLPKSHTSAEDTTQNWHLSKNNHILSSNVLLSKPHPQPGFLNCSKSRVSDRTDRPLCMPY